MPLHLRRISRIQKRKPARVFHIEDPGHLGFNYQIRLSSRKSISLVVRNGQVQLAAPHHASTQELQLWLESKLDWVRVKLKDQQTQQLQIPQRHFRPGELWPLLGHSYTLATRQGSHGQVNSINGVVTITLSTRSRRSEPDQIRSALEQWYKQQAFDILERKTRQVCLQLGASYHHIKLKRTRSKWGHCTPAGVIQYNWLIVQAPEFVVDYLVMHECCHLIHLNHSPAYWQLLEQFMPNYKAAKLWLKQHGHKLTL